MADDCDFLAGNDLDAILDMLEADEGVEEGKISVQVPPSLCMRF